MDIGLGLPISNPRRLLDWARRAEASGFATVALLDRLVYDNPEPLTALAVVAGATERIRLQTEVLLGPLRSTALLAKQVATLDRMSGGRFVLGIGVGGRADDHAAAGTPLRQRGLLLECQLTDLRRIWNGEAYSATGATDAGGRIGPQSTLLGGPPILIGAFAPAALGRVARHGDGFLCAAPLTWAAPLIAQVREQWHEANRAGRPRVVCQVNVAIGDSRTVDAARTAISDYYAFTGRPAMGAPISDHHEIAETLDGYRDLGADELVLYCYAENPDQIEQLADLVL